VIDGLPFAFFDFRARDRGRWRNHRLAHADQLHDLHRLDAADQQEDGDEPEHHLEHGAARALFRARPGGGGGGGFM
jgi:hypothetical protein